MAESYWTPVESRGFDDEYEMLGRGGCAPCPFLNGIPLNFAPDARGAGIMSASLIVTARWSPASGNGLDAPRR
jgi:hypothetical protein